MSAPETLPAEQVDREAAAKQVWPATCDGIEQDAFEEWARGERMVMDTHPLHWLFLDAETSAARKGWRAGLTHAADRARLATQCALDAAHFYIDASDGELASLGITRRDALDLARDLRRATGHQGESLPFINLQGNLDGSIPAPVAADLADLNRRNAKMQRALLELAAGIASVTAHGLIDRDMTRHRLARLAGDAIAAATADAETVGDIAEEFDRCAGRAEEQGS